jgi:hypothetical protein
VPPVNNHFRKSSQVASLNPIMLEPDRIVWCIADAKLGVAASENVRVWQAMVVGINYSAITYKGNSRGTITQRLGFHKGRTPFTGNLPICLRDQESVVCPQLAGFC